MAFNLKRIVSRSAQPAVDEPRPAGDPTDPIDLLPQVRSGLNEIEVTLADLSQREQALLAEASMLYEHLNATAAELADVRHQKATAAEHADKFKAAIQTLERDRSGTHTPEHSDASRKEAFVAVPEA